MNFVVLRLDDTNHVLVVASRPVSIGRVRSTRLNALLNVKVDVNSNFTKIKWTPAEIRLWRGRFEPWRIYQPILLPSKMNPLPTLFCTALEAQTALMRPRFSTPDPIMT